MEAAEFLKNPSYENNLLKSDCLESVPRAVAKAGSSAIAFTEKLENSNSLNRRLQGVTDWFRILYIDYVHV